MQINAGRGAEATSAALEAAQKQDCDVVMMQEPGGLFGGQRTLPRVLQQFYQIYLPAHDDGVRPRVATYVRKHNFSWVPIAQTTITGANRDILVMDFLASGGQRLRTINAYNAPTGCDGCDEGVAAFLNLDHGEEPCLLGGDLNLHHPDWSAPGWSGLPTAQASDFAAYMHEHGWSLGLEPGSITRPGASGGSALDLVFSNGPLSNEQWITSCEVHSDLAIGSDHWPIITRLRCGSGEPLYHSPRFRFERADWERFRTKLRQLEPKFLGAAVSRLRQCPADMAHEPLIDAAAESLQHWILAAMIDSIPRTATTGQGHPWWNGECTRVSQSLRCLEGELSVKLRSGLIDLPLLEATEQARRQLKRTLRKARRDFFLAETEKITGNQIFTARKWALGLRQYASPALRDELGGVHVTPDAKQQLLRRTLLPNITRQHPLDAFAHLPPGAERVLSPAITFAELRDAVWAAAPDKAAGPDEIKFRALREGWEIIGKPLHALVVAVFETGWFPQPYRTATLCALRKGGRRDPSLARSYRLISLLPVLGKTIEKVAANRLTYYVDSLRLVPSEQFGAMKGRSCTDAGLTLVHDVHVGWAQPHSKVTSVLFCDVVGAFDNVDPGRFVFLLWRLGLPYLFVRLLASWLADRITSLRLDGHTGAPEPTSVGLPQGSSLSMLCFVLYLSPLWDVLPEQVRMFGYVDDVALRAQGNTVEENCRTLEQAYRLAEEWATQNELKFDPKKRELIHFSSHHRQAPPNLPVRLGPHVEDTVVPVRRDGAVRWLGIMFNPKLSWDHHVRAQAAKARTAVGCLRMLANTIRGPSALLVRRAYVACIVPLLTQFCPVWWQGRYRTIPGGRNSRGRRVAERRVLVGARVKHGNMLDAVQNMALRIILPVWRTTPVTAMQRESSLPPISLLLDYLRDRSAIRLRSLAPDHPLSMRLQLRHTSLLTLSRRGAHRSPLVDMLREVQAVERHTVVPVAPWTESFASASGISITLPSANAREDVVRQHLQLLYISEPVLNAYSDGSMREVSGVRRAGSACAVYCADQGASLLLHHQRTHLQQHHEVFDAEVHGLLCAVEAALRIATARAIKQVRFFVDNAAVLTCLGQSPALDTSSGKRLARIRRRSAKWLERAEGRSLHFAWVPAHDPEKRIVGNERVDRDAKAACSPFRAPRLVALQTTASAKRAAKDKMIQAWHLQWTSSNAHRQYRRMCLTPPSLRPGPHLSSVPRRSLGLWLQAKTGHGDFISYHQRPQFHHPDARLECRCGRPKTRTHPLICHTYPVHQPLLRTIRTPNGRIDLPSLFDTPRGIEVFSEYTTLSRAYECNRD